LPAWKKAFFALLTVLTLLGLLEAALWIAGVRPALTGDDPFVGFVSTVPLFVEQTDPDGRTVMVTATNKISIFNPQRFVRDKAPDTFRIFTLGGSTTYGRPYADHASFSGWLRELLPAADPGRRWELINAGGISYASYRIAELMEELVAYEPDLFIVYTGHNEFLEERTYGHLRDLPEGLRSAMGVLARTRTWSAIGNVLRQARKSSAPARDQRSLLPNEVQAKLDRSVGPAAYTRNDALREGILRHFRFSLTRMIQLARAHGAEIVLVKPASNLRDCAPFKAEPTEGIGAQARARSESAVRSADEALDSGHDEEPLAALTEAIAADPRNAQLLYLRGKFLLALGRTDEAVSDFRRARDEDVCPLRALSALGEIVQEVAEQSGTPIVDYPELLAAESVKRTGAPIPGEELFLDHVHPTIDAHRLLALALIETLASEEIVHLGPEWNQSAIEEVTARVEAGIAPEDHARALGNLALVLNWAGKQEESRKLAMQALDSGVEDPTVLMIAARHLALEGRGNEALALFQRALLEDPGSPVLHSQFGMFRAGRGELEAAAAHFFLASLVWADNADYHQQLGSIMLQRGRPDVALASFVEARRIDPRNPSIEARIESARRQLSDHSSSPALPQLEVTRYPSGYPHTLAQTVTNADGKSMVHGIWTQWYDGGGLLRYVDYVDGQPQGVSVRMNREGVITRREAAAPNEPSSPGGN
jgi:Flp pilus assembly protein TadD